jgi:hypothetical protein
VRWALVLLGLLACERHRNVGHEREDCRPDHSCEPGLLCLSDLCVRPPAADCKGVAESLASAELGNYAPVEERAPLVANKRAACEAAHVSKDEAACLDKAHDKWSQAACVPRMFPEVERGSSGECTAIALKVRVLIAPQIAQAGSDAQRMIEKMLPVLQHSCEHDGWPADIKQCILGTTAGDLAGMQRCANLMPKSLQDRLQQQMTEAARPL